jgi:hypothetical protein
MFPAVVVAGCRHKVVLDAERCTEHVHGDAGGEQKISSVLEAAELRENEGNEDLGHEAAVQIRVLPHTTSSPINRHRAARPNPANRSAPCPLDAVAGLRRDEEESCGSPAPLLTATMPPAVQP